MTDENINMILNPKLFVEGIIYNYLNEIQLVYII